MNRHNTMTPIVALLLWAACQGAVVVPRSLTLGGSRMEAHRLAAVRAGSDAECDNIQTNYFCNPEREECSTNACQGEPYNPLSACKSDCEIDCAAEHPDDQEAYYGCVMNCHALCELLGYPDQLVKDCSRDLQHDRTPTRQNGFPRWFPSDTSNYSDVDHEPYHCRQQCNCSEYCYNIAPAGQGQNFQCGKFNCFPTSTVDEVNSSTAGVCPPDNGD